MRWVLIGFVVTTIGLMIGFKESKRTALAHAAVKANMSEVVCIGRDDDD